LHPKELRFTIYNGNHDDASKFSDTAMGNFSLVDKLVLSLDEKKAWIFSW
jgi:hypothetical protein